MYVYFLQQQGSDIKGSLKKKGNFIKYSTQNNTFFIVL